MRSLLNSSWITSEALSSIFHVIPLWVAKYFPAWLVTNSCALFCLEEIEPTHSIKTAPFVQQLKFFSICYLRVTSVHWNHQRRQHFSILILYHLLCKLQKLVLHFKELCVSKMTLKLILFYNYHTHKAWKCPLCLIETTSNGTSFTCRSEKSAFCGDLNARR